MRYLLNQSSIIWYLLFLRLSFATDLKVCGPSINIASSVSLPRYFNAVIELDALIYPAPVIIPAVDE